MPAWDLIARTIADSSTGRAALVPRWRTLLADAP